MRTFSVKNFEKFQHYKDRAPPWIKLYNELLDDYAFGVLPDATKFHLIAIWLLASRSDNKIPYDATWVARRINAGSAVDLASLVAAGFLLLDQELQTAEHVASIAPAGCLSREREEGETETEGKTDSRVVAEATHPRAPDRFDEFWKAYPRRDGANPRDPAEKKFKALVKTGVDPEVMIRAARELAREEGARGNVGSKFIPQAITWLNQQRFHDYAAVAFGADHPGELDWDTICVSFKKFGIWSKSAPGNDPSSHSCQCPPEILAKHGLGRTLEKQPADPSFCG